MEQPEQPSADQPEADEREMTPPPTMPAASAQMDQVPQQKQDKEPPWERVDSSNVHAIRRTSDGSTYVQFRTRNGEVSKTYHYDGIPDVIYEKMRAADSIGRFFHNQIRQTYKGTPIEDEGEESE